MSKKAEGADLVFLQRYRKLRAEGKKHRQALDEAAEKTKPEKEKRSARKKSDKRSRG